jgi:hypothetical protein
MKRKGLPAVSSILLVLGIGAVLISAAQAPAVNPGAPVLRQASQVPLVITNPLEVQGIPVPANMVQIKEGTPYAVPAGRTFVLTALGTFGSCTCTLFVDGNTEAVTTGLIAAMPAGLAVPPASTITVLAHSSCPGQVRAGMCSRLLVSPCAPDLRARHRAMGRFAPARAAPTA